jgi:TPR repeat protein
MNLISKALVLTVTLLSTTINASGRNLPLADKYFAEKKYEQALSEYISITKVGNPRAYYQLGVIHHNGYWVEKDFLESLIWFSLAAEHNYEDASDIVQKLLSQVSTKQRAQVDDIISGYISKFGKKSIEEQHYPIIDKQSIGFKVNLIDNTEHLVTGDTRMDENVYFEDNSSFNFRMDEEDLEDDFPGLGLGVGPKLSLDDLLNTPYFLIVDYDVAKDGSRRNLTTVESFGFIDKVLYSLKSTSITEPTFKDEPISFLDRSYKGLAYYTKNEFRDKQNILYKRIRKKYLKFKNKDNLTPLEKYQYASLLMNVTWLKSTDNQINQLLKESSKAGILVAQLEYGLKLYRDQEDIESAIYWISKAAQKTDRKAEYTLGKILLDSPWVVRDEAKALTWFESAAKKHHMPSMKKLTELKLLATDKSLRSTKEANQYLDELSKTQNMDPIYHYLRAIAYTKDESRQLGTAFQHMRRAISLASNLNWDVTEWNDWLLRWGQGKVTVQDL